MTTSKTSVRVGVVGGGPAGALCARILHEAQVDVTVFDKGRRPGGRLSTRQYERVHFDHGAQYMTARDPHLASRVEEWMNAGVLAPWAGQELEISAAGSEARALRERRLVGVPGMSALVDHLLRGLECHFEARAVALCPVRDQVEVRFDGRAPACFDVVVVAVPAPQAVPLLQPWPDLATRMAAVTLAPCWAAMVEFSRPWHRQWAAARVRDSPIAWIARNHTKPKRPDGEAWVIHATPEWSQDHLDDSKEDVCARLVEVARALTGIDAVPLLSRAHRWRYALVTKPVGETCLLDGPAGVCGDGLLGGRIENALVSGAALAERILTEHQSGFEWL